MGDGAAAHSRGIGDARSCVPLRFCFRTGGRSPDSHTQMARHARPATPSAHAARDASPPQPHTAAWGSPGHALLTFAAWCERGADASMALTSVAAAQRQQHARVSTQHCSVRCSQCVATVHSPGARTLPFAVWHCCSVRVWQRPALRPPISVRPQSSKQQSDTTIAMSTPSVLSRMVP